MSGEPLKGPRNPPYQRPIVGVKAYGWDWSSVHGLGMLQAAQRMVLQGLDWALVQNLIDPLPGSAVAQIPPQNAYDDRQWVAALQDAGLRVYQSSAVFFSPEAFTEWADIRPVDQWGKVFQPFGWYVGLCPTHPQWLARKIALLAQAVHATQPDGVFLSFLRFPGFWEMWLPPLQRSDLSEYCFCGRCMALFSQHTGCALPSGGPPAWRRYLVTEQRSAWTAWKCRWIGHVAQELRAAAWAVKPNLDIILNGFGLGTLDFDNAVEEVLGQRFSALEPAIDHYELMFYFQIMKRDPRTWIAERIGQVRPQTARTVLACLQAQAEYLEPQYQFASRSRDISNAQWQSALEAVRASGADGVLTYSWRDLLADEASGGQRVAMLQRYRSGEP